MVTSKLVLPVIAAAVVMSSAEAREVVLTSFGQAVVDAGRNDLAEPTSTAPLTPAADYVARPSTVPAPFTSELSAIRSCYPEPYAPTWWLRPEVEVRRAAHFEFMASIACEAGIPVNLLDAVIAQESGYNEWALSPAGAKGIMQIMPETASRLHLTDPWNARANMRAGAAYLRQQLDRFGRVDLALAAYNAGPERRALALGHVPAIPETLSYVRSITTNWVRLTKLGRPDFGSLARATAATLAVRASGYREVSLTRYDGTNAAKPM